MTPAEKIVVSLAFLASAFAIGFLGYQMGGVEGELSEVESRLKTLENTSPVSVGPPGEEIHFPNTTRWGYWSDPEFCPPNHYVCGLKQKVEAEIGRGGDDTTMNGMAFYCCPLNQ